MAKESFGKLSLLPGTKWKETGCGKYRPENKHSRLQVHTGSTVVGCQNE